MTLLRQKFLYRKRNSRHFFTELAIFRNQRGIQALCQRDVLRIIAGDGVFRRHGKCCIHFHFALRNFYEVVNMILQLAALRECQHFAPLIGRLAHSVFHAGTAPLVRQSLSFSRSL